MLKTQNPDYKSVIADKLSRQFFMKHIGFSLTKIEEGHIEGKLAVSSEIHHQQNHFIHGGVVSTLCDIVAGFAAFSLVAPGKHVVTAEIKISYLRPGKGDELFAKGWVLKPGNNFHFCESEVWSIGNNEKTLIAKATATMAVVEKF